LNSKTLGIGLMVALAAAIAAAGFACYERPCNEARSQWVAGTLLPMARLIKENQGLIQELQGEPFTGQGNGILEMYLATICRDGVARHADMKQRLDTLAENNTAIVTLFKAYAPHAKTAAFTAEADKFRNYASAWRDRWNSVMELFMAGGSYAASQVPFPKDLTKALQEEVAASK
jgi:hypothetical protein